MLRIAWLSQTRSRYATWLQFLSLVKRIQLGPKFPAKHAIQHQFGWSGRCLQMYHLLFNRRSGLSRVEIEGFPLVLAPVACSQKS